MSDWKDKKCNKAYVMENLLLALNQGRTGNAGLILAPILMLHMDNSIYHNGAKIIETMPVKGLGEHPIQTIHQILVPVISGHSEQLTE
jgi:hypothetical protein